MRFSKLFVFAVAFLTAFGAPSLSYAAPPAVSNLSGAPSTNSILISWTTPSLFDLSEFEVRYSANPLNETNFNLAPQVSGVPQPIPGQNQSVNVSGLQEGTVYYVGVRVYNIMGQASPVAFVSATTQTSGGGGGGGGGGCAAAPASVGSFSATATTNSAALSWVTPSANDLSEFEVRYSENSLNSGNFNIAPQVSGVPQPIPGQNQSVNVSGLQGGKTYYFGIIAYNICGQSSPLAVASVTTGGSGGGGSQCMPPLPVSNLVSTPDITSVSLSWTTPTQFELAEIEIRRSTSPIIEANYNIAPQVSGVPQPIPGQSQNVGISGLNPETVYYFGIKTYNICGAASPLMAVSATTKNTNGGGGNGGGGGGGGGGYFGPLIQSPSILINNGDAKTQSTDVVLSLGAVNAVDMAISNDANFFGGQWEVFSAKKNWQFTSDEGIKIVYAMFRDANGFVSDKVSDDILYEIPKPEPPAPTPPPPSPTPPPPPPPPAPQPQVFGVSTRVDFNTIMVNWGIGRYGNASDLNKDGFVDNRDVEELAMNWNDIEVNKQDDPVAYPTTFFVSPKKLTVIEGQKLSYVVTVFPRGEKDYTAQITLRYPVELLEVESIAYARDWIPVVRPEYDVNDTEKGILVKTAGIPEGFSDKKTFAVVTFIAKQSGGGSISFGGESYSLDFRNKNKLIGVSIPDQASATLLDSSSGQLAALASIITFGTNGNFVAFLTLLVFFAILYAAYKLIQRGDYRKPILVGEE